MRAKLVPDGVVDRLAPRSPRLAAYLDWCDHGNMWSSGGPMNGQLGRQLIVRDLACLLRPTAAVETGTYRGETTAFLADVTGATTYSCELAPRYHGYAVRRFRRRADVHLELADSPSFLRGLAQRPDVPDHDVLFYLDAHWYRELPLAEELGLIRRHWTRSVVVIDDFEVPDDDGYGYDDYGPGRRLTADYLPEEVVAGQRCLYPTIPASEETGARRGCVVIVDEDRADLVCERVALAPR